VEFGIGFDTHVDKWDLARYGEEPAMSGAGCPIRK
jgi:hypothetical protein